MTSNLADGIFHRLIQHRDSILRQHRWLAGDEVSPTAAVDAWQINAGNLAEELRKYADLLEAISAGLCPGPLVFPSWDTEPTEEGDKGYDDVSGFMAAVRHDIQLAKDEKKAEGGQQVSEEQVWEFTFKCVQAAESREEALSAALEYLGEYADKGELEPTDSRVLGDGEYDVIQ